MNPAIIKTSGSSFLGNSKYGLHRTSNSLIDIIFNQTYKLYSYGRAMVILLLLATVVFMGQELNYKTDNIWITMGVIYLVLPTLELFPSASSLNSYSFLYGFAWSTFLELFSDPRGLSSSVTWFDGYL